MRYQLAKSKETVIFLHVPKTAGTTLDQIIYRHYRFKEVYETGLISQQGVQDYIKMAAEERANYRLLKGHLNFGIHEYAPQPWAYFTFLREPVDRTISHIYFIHRNTDHPAYALFKGQDINMKEYLDQQLDPMLFNAHTRLLSGVWDSIPARACTPVHLEMAKDNLKNHIKVIGLTERFDESLLILGSVFGWNHLYYKRLNVTKKRPQKETIPPDFLQAVQEANELDIVLYEYAQTLFEEQLRQLGPNFKNDVAQFRIKNKYAQPFASFYWEMRKISVREFIRTQWAHLTK